MCLTAQNPVSKIKQTTMVFGRPLNDGMFAMLFLNDFNATKSVTCDTACLKNMMTLKPTFDDTSHVELVARAAGSYSVEEVWSGGKTLGGPLVCNATGCGSLTVSVGAHGATTYVRLVPRK